MTEFTDRSRTRNINEITDGEITIYASSDGGTTFYPIKCDTGGGLRVGGNTKTIVSVAINFNTAATHEIIAADATRKIKIVSYDLVVGGETNITLKHGATAFSGPYDYGGTSEPRGLVRNFPSNYPLEIGVNEAFNITSSAAVQVSGLVQYYLEA